MLGQLIQNNNLLGWNIFEDRHNKLCCNIRFDIELGGHVTGSVGRQAGLASQNNTHGTEPCKYRRVSTKQQVRANERLHKFKSANPATTKENQYHHSDNDIQNKKRKCDSFTTELPRIDYNDSDSDSIHLIDSPEAVKWIKDSSTVHILASTNSPVPVTATNSPVPVASTNSPVPDTTTLPAVDTISSSTKLDESELGLLHTTPASSAEIPPTPVITPNPSPPSSFLYPPEQSQPIDSTDTQINCPCCEKIMTVNHACDNDSDEDSLVLDKPNNDTIATPLPVPNFSPQTSHNHPPQRPKTATPDTKRSTQSQNMLMACRAWANSAKM
jgi:hypothetical protein